MIKRMIEISGSGNRLNIRHNCLCIESQERGHSQIPLEDLGVLVLDAPDTCYTHSVIIDVLDAGAVIIPCSRSHLPQGIFLPQNNQLQTQRIGIQVDAKLPLKKQLWKQIVRQKILNQASTLHPNSLVRSRLKGYASDVKSGDSTNREACAARSYWPELFGKDFRRSPRGNFPNCILNYGYMVFRASMARAICKAGLHPSLGLYHSNRSNHFSLADDLFEPFRPMVDKEVEAIVKTGFIEIDKDVKFRLLSLLRDKIHISEQESPVQLAMDTVVASLVHCFEEDCGKLELPEL